MNLTEVKKSIEKQLSHEPRMGAGRNIVFWYDEEGVFAEHIDTLELENAKIIKLYDNNMFAVKLYIEDNDKTSNLLVYSPMPRPKTSDNWLADTIKYSTTFTTDETSLNLLNFKIDHSLRFVVDRYKLFFRNSERCKKLESYSLAPYIEQKIDIGVLSALCKLPAPSLDNVVKLLLIEMATDETALIDSIEKYADVTVLWGLIRKAYGYAFPDNSFEKLAITLLVTHLSHSINGKMPSQWSEYAVENTSCFVFVDNFMKNIADWDDYNNVAKLVADRLRLAEHISSLTVDEVIECDTFDDFDKHIILRLRENIVLDVGEYEKYRKIINNRRNKRFWSDFETEYEVLLSGCEFLELCRKHTSFSERSAAALFENYTKEYYKFDYHYRRFIGAIDNLDDNAPFSDLFDKVENAYTNWYLGELSVKWCELLDDEQSWGLAGVTPQQRFYEKYIRSFVSDNERVIVIVSDGLRYESAKELLAILNAEQKGKAELSFMQGVIPSYTKLGMAALLPHKNIAITDKADVLIDGISSQGTENREKILKLYKPEAVAITYENLLVLSKNKTKLSERFSGQKLIYIYHDCIDARGDNVGTEREVFEATAKSFKELSGLIRILKNGISAINIIITSDHGYIYRRTPLVESDKTPKEADGSIEKKRRFILTKQNTDIQSTQRFSMSYLDKALEDIQAVTPRAANCYKIQGSGTGYVHGGTSLQEVVVPVIKFKSDKNSSKSMGAKKVSLSLTNISRKITSIITYLSFFQNEKVEEKVLPLRAKAYFCDDKGERVSNENIIIAESTSINPADRTYKEKFTFKNIQFDKSKEYLLVIEDDDELVTKELDRIPFIIDLVFGGGIKF